jgi:hypothetical protein
VIKPKSKGRVKGHVASMEDKRNSHRVLVETSKDKKSLGIPRCTCEDNIKMYLRKTGWKGVACVHLAQNGGIWCALWNRVTKLRYQ